MIFLQRSEISLMAINIQEACLKSHKRDNKKEGKCQPILLPLPLLFFLFLLTREPTTTLLEPWLAALYCSQCQTLSHPPRLLHLSCLWRDSTSALPKCRAAELMGVGQDHSLGVTNFRQCNH